jgi:hypothetical protein
MGHSLRPASRHQRPTLHRRRPGRDRRLTGIRLHHGHDLQETENPRRRRRSARVPHPHHAPRRNPRSHRPASVRLGGANAQALARRRHRHVHRDFWSAGRGHAEASIHHRLVPRARELGDGGVAAPAQSDGLHVPAVCAGHVSGAGVWVGEQLVGVDHAGVWRSGAVAVVVAWAEAEGEGEGELLNGLSMGTGLRACRYADVGVMLSIPGIIK